ncbi:hypothetical protein LTR85_003882 [Meristemomyces frigidus]|nr:hypothetical protein LTR85_003882 [Meristemomyces frigidus]
MSIEAMDDTQPGDDPPATASAVELEAMAPSLLLQTAKETAHAMTPAELNEAEPHIHILRRTASPLLKLPPELRNQIYYFAALDAIPAHADYHAPKPPALLTVSRQIRQEFSSLYFSDAVMTLELASPGIQSDAPRWKRVTDPSVLKALLAAVTTSDYEQSASFRAIFGATKTGVFLRYTSRTPPGDIQLARCEAIKARQSGLPYEAFGILVFAAASGVKSRIVGRFLYL